MPTLAGCTFSSQQPVSFSNFLSARMDQLFGWFSCLFYLGVSCGCLYSLLKQALRNLDINIIHLVLCQWGSLWTRTTALRQNALPVIGRSKEKRIQFSIAGLKLRKQLKRTGNASDVFPTWAGNATDWFVFTSNKDRWNSVLCHTGNSHSSRRPEADSLKI